MKAHWVVVHDSIENEEIQVMMENWGGIQRLNGLWVPEAKVMCVQDPEGQFEFYQHEEGEFDRSFETEISQELVDILIALAAHEKNAQRAQNELDQILQQNTAGIVRST